MIGYKGKKVKFARCSCSFQLLGTKMKYLKPQSLGLGEMGHRAGLPITINFMTNKKSTFAKSLEVRLAGNWGLCENCQTP